MIPKVIFWCAGSSYSSAMILFFWVLGSLTLARSPGKPGCKNEKSGGDNVAIPSSGSSCCVYVVYRSFKYPPPVKPLKPFKVISTGQKNDLKIAAIDFLHVLSKNDGTCREDALKKRMPMDACVHACMCIFAWALVVCHLSRVKGASLVRGQVCLSSSR